jgi:periplasmic divalent cation tolerance protein
MSDAVASEELLVFVTIASAAEGAHLAAVLVGERLAACVNIVPSVQSVYRWQGQVQHDNEALLVVKTVRPRYHDLERRIREIHPYTTPEIIAIPIERGLPAYLQWLRESTQ